ncbi:hypothetical protein K788_0001806 (plasmid) [Paraburkholderia caribensis MBA4]|uniref:Uncharacterized protein n=1 Tax=Paraburkholderia caribensis MBA4 TaxID=1323664 RepID=A0A0N7JW96_9BURK|nr:hypothetical protein K788_0001806 [Paraburkholderia caribensis MBA4]
MQHAIKVEKDDRFINGTHGPFYLLIKHVAAGFRAHVNPYNVPEIAHDSYLHWINSRMRQTLS